ncbi:hypothetical protein cypCar_00014813 [Cyprinus carpio]|nr:hypothetical protein cypCar_00014813 [Cyprinus carpio]
MDLTTVPFPSLNSSADTNGTSAPRPPPHSQCAAVLIILVVTVIILVTIVGNVLVVVAVFTSRALRAPQNLFLVSLASADILVATLVIPFSLANEVMGYWYFGSTWCAFYLALDVLFCTSSIVHLCAISLDRYWSVTKAVSYNLKRTPRRIKFMITVVWVISAVISFPPLLMTKHDELECLLNNETWYILSSCMVSFFAPGLIMILVYCKIYRVAKQRASTVFVAKNGMERQPSQSETCFVRKGKDTLSRDARDRYVDKIGTINGLDQYENPNKEWSTDDELLPHFCITDIFGYLVCFVSAYTSEQFRSYKSLESHVQFTNGWVKELQIIKPANSWNSIQ